MDVTFTTDVLVTDGDLVARRWTMRATHQGPFLGVAPTGRRVTMTGIDVLRVVDGRFTEIWHNEDVAGEAERQDVRSSSSPPVRSSVDEMLEFADGV